MINPAHVCIIIMFDSMVVQLNALNHFNSTSSLLCSLFTAESSSYITNWLRILHK